MAIARINPVNSSGTDDSDQVINLRDDLTSDSPLDDEVGNIDDSSDADKAIADLERALGRTESGSGQPAQTNAQREHIKAVADLGSELLEDASAYGGRFFDLPTEATASTSANPASATTGSITLFHSGCLQCPFLVPSLTNSTVTGTFRSKSSGLFVEKTVPVERLPCQPVRNTKCPARSLTINVRSTADRQAESLLRSARELAERNASADDRQVLLSSALRLARLWPESIRASTISAITQLLSAAR